MSSRGSQDCLPPTYGKAMPWLFWGLAALFYCYGFFHRVSPSVMVDELMREFEVSAAALGNLTAFYFYAYAGLQLPVGVLTDRFGARRILALAALLCGLGSLLFAMAEHMPVAYAGRVLIGAGAGFSWVGALKIIATWFPPRRFALVSGLTLMLGMMGGIGGQAPLAALVEAIGWRGTLLGAAGLGISLGLVIWAVVRDAPETPADTNNEAAGAPHGTGLLDGLGKAITTPQTWIIGLFALFMTGPMLSFGGLWGVPYIMTAYEVARPGAALAASMMLVGWAIGAPLSGWISDHLQRRKLPMLIGGAGSLLTILLAIYVPLPLSVVYGCLLLNGVFAGTTVISFAVSREHNLPGASGAVIGMVNMLVMSSGALFQPLIGWLLDLGWDGVIVDGVRVYAVATYKTALLTLPACGVAAVVMAALVRETHCRSVH